MCVCVCVCVCVCEIKKDRRKKEPETINREDREKGVKKHDGYEKRKQRGSRKKGEEKMK